MIQAVSQLSYPLLIPPFVVAWGLLVRSEGGVVLRYKQSYSPAAIPSEPGLTLCPVGLRYKQPPNCNIPYSFPILLLFEAGRRVERSSAVSRVVHQPQYAEKLALLIASRLCAKQLSCCSISCQFPLVMYACLRSCLRTKSLIGQVVKC